jgi:hypothetical protein
MIEMVKITPDEAQGFKQAKRLPETIASTMRRALWAEIKRREGLPVSGRYKVQCTDPQGADYLVVKEKHTGMPVGRAESFTPYGCIEMHRLAQTLAVSYEASAVPLPAVGTTPVGSNCFVGGGKLFFPLF